MGADDVAVVGLDVRVPGALTTAEFWDQIREGRIAITDLGPTEGERVGARGVLPGVEHFDSELFGFGPAEAAALDPQSRVFLELCWRALEDANVDSSRMDLPVALYAGASPAAPRARDEHLSVAEEYARTLASEVDFLPTRVSHRLDLRGESMLVQTGCSSSLVAVHLACQSLLSGQSDLAIAGGISIAGDQSMGYLHQEGMISSPAGRCRPFDAAASGTVPGSGGAAVVLQRLDDALAAGARVRAVIKGTAVNNDGRHKQSFMAPSSVGQAAVIATALAVADIDAASVGLIEAHGTATLLGDAVEVAALRKAYADASAGSVALGSVKGAIGHLDRAAGIVGFTKIVLCLEAGVIPPAPGSVDAAPAHQLETSPFYLPQTARDWSPAARTPRRAAVSSFGVGGTNAHAVLEQAPSTPSRPPAVDPAFPSLVTVSGASLAGAEAGRRDLAERLHSASSAALGEIAVARNRFRTALRHRVAAVGQTPAEAADGLLSAEITCAFRRPVVFMFPGHGSRALADVEALASWSPAARDAVDRCRDALTAMGWREDPSPLSMQTGQPTLFVAEFALAQAWIDLGVTPDAMVGHSMGEIVAATLAGVFDLPGALRFVWERGRALDATPGAMLSVGVPEAEVHRRWPDIDIAAVNAPELSVVSGPGQPIARIEAECVGEELFSRRLAIASAAHSRMMDGQLEELRAVLGSLQLNPARLPIASGETGRWVDPAQLADPDYWLRHARGTVRFGAALATAARNGVLLECGPGETLSRLVDQQPALAQAVAVASLAGTEPVRSMLSAAAAIWTHGGEIDLGRLPGTELPAGRSASLPPYCFDHARRWPIGDSGDCGTPAVSTSERALDPAQWIYQGAWRRPVSGSRRSRRRWLISGGTAEAASTLDARLTAAGHTVACEGDPLPGGPTDVIDLSRLGRDPDFEQTFLTGAELLQRLRSAHEPATSLRYWAVCSGLESVEGEAVTPPTAAILGLERVAPQEMSEVSWTTVDVLEERVSDMKTWTQLAELLHDAPDEPRIALRPDGAWAPDLKPAWPLPRPRGLRDNGVYLITGGLGPVGRAIAEAIVEAVDAPTVVLMSRGGGQSPDWAAATTSYEVTRCDVTDVGAVRTLVADLIDRHGSLDGVVHAAGFTDRSRFRTIADVDGALLAEVSAAKVEGTRALAAALAGRRVDFVMLCSSLSTLLGGLRFAPYVAANAYLDSFATERHLARDRAWLSVRWDAWRESGEAAGELGRLALSREEGREVFYRALAAPGPVVTVSTSDPRARIGLVARTLSGSPVAPPAEPAEHSATAIVRGAVRETLGDEVALNEDLIRRGLDSLRFLELIGRISRRAGVRVDLAAAFRTPTVAALTALVDASGMETPLPPLVPANANPSYPSTTLQRRWNAMARSGFGEIDLRLALTGPIDADRLAGAVAAASRRHSGLRTVFAERDSEIVQRIVENHVPLEIVDARGLSDGEFDTLTRHDAFMNLSGEIPLRLRLLRRHDEAAVLQMVVHHILFDGTSSTVFFNDLARAYAAGDLPVAPFQYVDFAAWQRDYMASSGFAREREHWQRHFADAPAPLVLPGDLLGPERDLYGHAVYRSVTAEGVDRVRRRARRAAVTPFTVLTAAFGRLMGRLAGALDIVIGTTAAGRPLPETSEIVGCFVNPLPVRLTVLPDEDDDTLLTTARDELTWFHQHQAYWLEDLVLHVDPFVGLGQNDTFRAYILYQNYAKATRRIGDATYTQLWVPEAKPIMRDIELTIEEEDDGSWTLELAGRRARYSENLLNGWLDAYLDGLMRMAK